MMQYDKQQRSRAQRRSAREPKAVDLGLLRLAFQPKEFSAACGRSVTWAYRRIYCGDIKVIADAGRLLIPRSEVDRFLARAGQYNPQPKSSRNEKGNGGATTT